MSEQPYPESMSDLLERIHTSRDLLEERVTVLKPGGLGARMANGWTLKEHLVHVAAWEASIAGILRRERRGPAMGLEPALFDGDWQTDDINAALVERASSMSDEEVETWFARAHEEILAMLGTMVDVDLTLPFNVYQPFPGAPDDAPIVRWIVGDTYGHYAEHLEQLVPVEAAK